MKTTLIRVLAGMALAVTALALPTSPASATTDVDVRPGSLPKGNPPAIPYLHSASDDSWSVVDPKTGTKTPITGLIETESPTLVGRSGNGFIIRLAHRSDRVIRVELDKPSRTIIDDLHYQSWTKMSADNRYLLTTAFVTNGTQVRIRDAVTGAIVARHNFRNTTRPNPIDVSGTRVLIGGFSPSRTMIWNWSTEAIQTIASTAAYTGAFNIDRMATYTKNQYEDGACSVVSTISRPGTTLWRSCTEAVGAFSPDGARIITEAIVWREDATVVRRRSVRGTLLANYRNPNGVWVHGWESNTRVLIESAPYAGSGWLVRCEGLECERAAQAY